MMIKSLIGSIIIIICFGASSHADIFSYTDKDGVTHFTNISQGKNYKKIITEPPRTKTERFERIISSKSGKYGLEPEIIKAVITAESNWNPKAVSRKGAIGLMQLMPSTAKEMKISDPYNPEENIEAGTRYLRHLLDRFDEDLDLALAAYNAGPGNVEKAGGIPAFIETRMFVKSVKSFYKDFSLNKVKPIYRLTLDDGTVMFTNTPSPYKQYNLSKF